MGKLPSAERRSAPRYECELPVALRLLHNPTVRLPALSRDLGSGGIFLYTNVVLPVGEHTVITLKLPVQVKGKQTRLLAVGRVVRVEESEKASGLGVTIEQYVRKLTGPKGRRRGALR